MEDLLQSQRYEEDAYMNAIVKNLRDIDRRIQILLKQANKDWEDYEALKSIIESITL